MLKYKNQIVVQNNTKKISHIVSILIGLFYFASCSNSTKDLIENQPIENAFIESLVEKQILTDIYPIEYKYTISIPSDYSIDELDAEDFVVYYIVPTDTTVQSTFSGGIYLGNHPSSFECDSCEKKTIENTILGEKVEWTIYKCNTTYSTQTLIESGSRERWCKYIHLFGEATSESELEKLFAVFKTFSKSEKIEN